MEGNFQFHCIDDLEIMNINLPHAWAVFSTKKGGTSSRDFCGLNMALHVGDDIQSVLDNRRRFAQAAGFSFDNVVCAQQVHGINVEQVGFKERGKGAGSYEDAIPDTDAMITAEQGVILAAFFADCVPVYIADPVKGVVALAHAGWKGTLNGIVGQTLQRMQKDNGTDPSDCFAFIGPSIGPCCYEVSRELACTFEKKGFPVGCSYTGLKEKWMLDLWEANKKDLIVAGLSPQNIEISGICTVCWDTRFFSHRRDAGRTGRMAAFISLTE